MAHYDRAIQSGLYLHPVQDILLARTLLPDAPELAVPLLDFCDQIVAIAARKGTRRLLAGVAEGVFALAELGYPVPMIGAVFLLSRAEIQEIKLAHATALRRSLPSHAVVYFRLTDSFDATQIARTNATVDYFTCIMRRVAWFVRDGLAAEEAVNLLT